MRSKNKIECPRCGSQGSIFQRNEKGTIYRYCIHRFKLGGKWKSRWCYLGPIEYSKVTRSTTQPIRTRGLGSGCLELDYLSQLLDKISTNPEMRSKAIKLILERLPELSLK